MTNTGKLQVFGMMVLLAGMGGGWIGQRLANRKYEKKVKECQEELEKARKDFDYEMDRVKEAVRSEMSGEAKTVIADALDEQAREVIWEQVSERARKIDMDAMAKEVVDKHMAAASKAACNAVKSDATVQLEGAINDIVEKVTELIEDKVEEWVNKEMYHVNSRRIIEDCVDRAVREEIGDTVRNKLKLLNVDNLRAFLL